MKQSQGLLPQVICYPKTLTGIQVYSPLCKQSGNIFGAAPSSVCKLCVCVVNFQEDRSDGGTSPPKLVDVYLVGAHLNRPWLKPAEVGLSRLSPWDHHTPPNAWFLF